MGILSFTQFTNSIKENDQYTEDELNKMDQLGVGPEKKFRDWFEVLDFFGGAIPGAYNIAKRKAAERGYSLPMNLWDEALMNSLDGEQNEDDEMYEATAAEIAVKKADLAKREAAVAQARAALAQKKAAIKPDQADALQAKAAVEAEEAKLAQQEADIAKENDVLSKTQPTA